MDHFIDRENAEFGRLLHFWRKKRRLSQVELAALADSTPRHMSFIETGRSRPGRDLILRLARAMDLPVRDVNALMVRAGLPPEYAEYDLDADLLQPYRAAIDAILNNHNPFPACAVDAVGSVLLSNEAFKAFSPSALFMNREEYVDQMFDPNGPMPQFIENWEEIVWTWLDHQNAELITKNSPRLAALVKRANDHLKGLKRPEKPSRNEGGVLSPRFRVGDQTISTFSTTMRFQHASEVTLSEIRIELIFPADAASRQFFENLYESPPTLPS